MYSMFAANLIHKRDSRLAAFIVMVVVLVDVLVVVVCDCDCVNRFS